MKARGHKDMFGRCGTTTTRIGRFAIKSVGGAGIALMGLITESLRAYLPTYVFSEEFSVFAQASFIALWLHQLKGPRNVSCEVSSAGINHGHLFH